MVSAAAAHLLTVLVLRVMMARRAMLSELLLLLLLARRCTCIMIDRHCLLELIVGARRANAALTNRRKPISWGRARGLMALLLLLRMRIRILLQVLLVSLEGFRKLLAVLLVERAGANKSERVAVMGRRRGQLANGRGRKWPRGRRRRQASGAAVCRRVVRLRVVQAQICRLSLEQIKLMLKVVGPLACSRRHCVLLF